MARIPDLADPRYLDEVGFFVYQEHHADQWFGRPYQEERASWSLHLLDLVLRMAGKDRAWLRSKVVVSVGCGCAGELSAWPAAVKIGVDPLLATYRRLDMLAPDAPGTPPTVHLSVGAEDIPVVDGLADLVVCRNALDHMIEPERGLAEMQRILVPDGLVYLSVDIGGDPTPDEPTVFTVQSLTDLVGRFVEIEDRVEGDPPHSKHREQSVRLLGRKRGEDVAPPLDKEALLRGYERRIEEITGEKDLPWGEEPGA